MGNAKSGLAFGGLTIVLTFVAVLIEVIFIPLITTQLTSLKATAPTASINSTIDAMIELMYITPLGTIIVGFLVAFAGVFLVAKKAQG